MIKIIFVLFGGLFIPSVVLAAQHIFTFDELSKEKKITNFQVISWSSFNEGEAGENNVSVRFKGTATINGSWLLNYSVGDGYKVCMKQLSASSRASLPRLANDLEAQVICFSNDAFARREFGSLNTRGGATVMISDYIYNRGYSIGETWNEATLIRVIKKQGALAQKIGKSKHMKRLLFRANIKLGDRVGSMTVVKTDTALKSPPGRKQLPKSEKNLSVAFKGKATINGSWDRREFGGDIVCMTNLDNASEAQLPRLKNDTRAQWFCFSNDKLAKSIFGPLGANGIATVIIDSYNYVFADADVWNEARLVRAIKKTTRN